jgi:hypothetical protein
MSKDKSIQESSAEFLKLHERDNQSKPKFELYKHEDYMLEIIQRYPPSFGNKEAFINRSKLAVEFQAGVAWAESKLAKLIESCPVVYSGSRLKAWSADWVEGDTHQARLICIEPLKVEALPCLNRHAPSTQQFGNGVIEVNTNAEGKIACSGCGVELTATWKAKGE